MKRLLCPEIPKPGKPALLPETEAEHATRVLRLRDGELVQAMDGKGGSALCVLRTRGGPPRLEVTETGASEASGAVETSSARALPITLEMAVLKGEAMEWVVEKAVELGVERLVPVLTEHCVVQLKNKGPEAFRERWQKIADQALKQCGRLTRLEIANPVRLKDYVTQPLPSGHTRLWCDESAASGEPAPFLMDALLAMTPQNAPLMLLVGPEGGWSVAERELLLSPAVTGTRRVGLGPRILRAETAALFGISLLSGIQQRDRS